MLVKGIIFLLICALFVSRLIPKYSVFRETNQVNFIGIVWEGNVGFLVFFGVAVLAIILLFLGITNIYQYFSTAHNKIEK